MLKTYINTVPYTKFILITGKLSLFFTYKHIPLVCCEPKQYSGLLSSRSRSLQKYSLDLHLFLDSFDNRDSNFFDHIVKQQLERNQYKVHYCVFEGVYKRTQDNLQSFSNIALYDFVSGAQESKAFQQLAERLSEKDLIVIDSLANVIFQLGLAGTYRILNTLKNNKGD